MFICYIARARNNVVRPAAVPQMQTGPEALAAQVSQYKSRISSITQSPTAVQGTMRAQVPQPQLQQFSRGMNKSNVPFELFCPRRESDRNEKLR